MKRCNFRPHSDGYGVNAHSAILPLRDEAATRAAALALLAEIASWLQAHSGAFGAGDRIQLVVGFPESVKSGGRQIFKCYVPASRLAELRGVDFVAESNIVDRHIRSLRIKLQDDYRHPRFIATVPGEGYRFIPIFTNLGWNGRATTDGPTLACD